MPEDNFERVAEKVIKSNVSREKGYLYFIDEEGDVARVPAKWNKDPKFLEKVEHDAPTVERQFREMQVNYAEKEEPHEQPIPVVPHMIPREFMDKLIVYSDKAVVVTVGDKGLNKSHVRVYPVHNAPIKEITDAELMHAFTVSSMTSSILYEALKAHGSNIILCQQDGRLNFSIIPRFENDGLNLMWESKPGDRSQIKRIAGKIKDALLVGEKKDFTKINLDSKVNIIDKKKVDEDAHIAAKKVNYMIEHLRKLN